MTKEEALKVAIQDYQTRYDDFMMLDAGDVLTYGHTIGMAEQADNTIKPVIDGLKRYCES